MTAVVDLTVVTGFGQEARYVDGLLGALRGRIPDAREFALRYRTLLLAARNGVHADVSLGAMPFEERAAERATPFDVGDGRWITTCSAEDLIVHKAFAGRDKDWLDITGVVTRQPRLDRTLIFDELVPLLELEDDPLDRGATSCSVRRVSDFDQLSTKDGYDRWAAVYDHDGNPLIALEEPRVDALLGDVAGVRVLDVGCGTGRHALRLAAAGARVTAIDFSDGMLAHARAKPGADAVTFVEHDLARPLPFDARSFDRVVCGLVVDHIADLASLFREMRRVSRGAVVVSVMHPAMMLKGVQARFTDPSTGRETRPASVPNQISDYVMAALRAGGLEHVGEHAVDDALAARLPRAQRYLGWPMLLMLRLR